MTDDDDNDDNDDDDDDDDEVLPVRMAGDSFARGDREKRKGLKTFRQFIMPINVCIQACTVLKRPSDMTILSFWH